MTINHVFYKNNLIAEIEKTASEIRNQLLDELYSAGSDPVLYKRRYRMLKHLHLLQAQLIDKVYNFVTDDPRDYLEMSKILTDLFITTSRNA
jgi:hypothetical protein